MFIYYVIAIDGSYLELGFIISLSSFIASVIQPYIGYISDKNNARKTTTVGCCIVIFSLLFCSTSIKIWQLLFLYISFQIGIGIVSASMYSVVSRLKLNENKSFIPYYRSAQGMGVMLGPLLGGLITNFSLNFNVVVAACICTISLVCFLLLEPQIYMVVHDERESEKNQTNNFIFALRCVAKNKIFVTVCILFVFLELAFDLIRYHNSVLGEYLGANSALIGLAFSAYFVTFTIFQIPVNNLLKRISTYKSLLIMSVLSLISSSVFIINARYELVVLGMALSGITVGSLFTYCTIIAAKAAPEKQKGLYLGVFNVIMPLTDVMSPISVAFFWGISPRFAYIISAGLLIVFILLTLIAKDKIKNIIL